MRLIRKNITENINLVPLNRTNFSNLKYDNDNTKNDSVNQALLDDIQAAAKSVGIVATITTAKSGHNRLVKSGRATSRHMNGTGVDVAILNGIGAGGATNATNGNAQFRELGFKLKDALVSMGYVWNREAGNTKAVLWQTTIGGNHFNHLHISNNSGLSSGQPDVSKISSDDNYSGDTSNSTDSGDNNNKSDSELAQLQKDNELLKNIFVQGLGLDKFKDKFLNSQIKEEINNIKSFNDKLTKKNIINEKLTANSTVGSFTIISDKDGHAKRPLGNWQSDNAWDLKAPIGTSVYSYTKGTVTKVRQSPGSTKIFGTQVTVNGEDGYPNIFYTHLEDVKLTTGSKVNVGDFIGKITRWPANPGNSHVHIGLQTGDLGDLISRNPNSRINTSFDANIKTDFKTDFKTDDYKTSANPEDELLLKNIFVQGLGLDKFKDAFIKDKVQEEITKIKKLL